ncbi:MAG: hypothetical protein ACOYXT_29525 [Bacteroidota bacterium]
MISLAEGYYSEGRDRNAGCPAPPAQIRTRRITAYGSYCGNCSIIQLLKASSLGKCYFLPQFLAIFDGELTAFPLMVIDILKNF